MSSRPCKRCGHVHRGSQSPKGPKKIFSLHHGTSTAPVVDGRSLVDAITSEKHFRSSFSKEPTVFTRVSPTEITLTPDGESHLFDAADNNPNSSSETITFDFSATFTAEEPDTVVSVLQIVFTISLYFSEEGSDTSSELVPIGSLQVDGNMKLGTEVVLGTPGDFNVVDGEVGATATGIIIKGSTSHTLTVGETGDFGYLSTISYLGNDGPIKANTVITYEETFV